ncbi:hypothetical protein T492DRAFT_940197 [Pavlovales sp. CCMP2436]|nr:hypothetical protein T492DRAFT_940197 [Pavlovales sp. CCMP2436]
MAPRGPRSVFAIFAASGALIFLVTYQPFVLYSANSVAQHTHISIIEGPRRILPSLVRAAAALPAAAVQPAAVGQGVQSPAAEARPSMAAAVGAGVPPSAAAVPQAAVGTRAPAAADTPATAAAPVAIGVSVVAAVPAAASEACRQWCGRFWGTWCAAVALVGCDVAFPPLVVQGMVEAGFSAQSSVRALNATGALVPSDVRKAIRWAIEQGGREKGFAEFNTSRETKIFEHADFDGYAIKWGNTHRKANAQACADACMKWEPIPPTWFVCNTFVFCGKPKCFAPAALPPGDMTGQCWIKHQEDPSHPQFNMKGRYSDAYRKSHPTAPEVVEWDSGVVVPAGTCDRVSLDTPSARANWR